MKTEQVTGAIDKLLEVLDIESVRAMVKSLDLNAPAEINEAAIDYFAGPIGGKATHEMGQEISGMVFELYKLPEIDTDTKCIFAGAYAAHNLFSNDNGPLTAGEVFIAFCAYHLANIRYRVRIAQFFGVEGLKKVEEGLKKVEEARK